MKNRNSDIAILVFIVAACAIPFLGQPFHMDDGFYMDMARNVRHNPLFPNDAPYMFQGVLWPDMGSHSHPLFQTYFLAGIQSLFGEGPGREWIYHLFALLFPILAVLSFYWMCARFVARPLWPAMLLACSPLFMVTQHTLMTDMPMLAFWLGAICCFLWATQLRHTGLYVLSAGFQVAAAFTSFQALALIPLLGFYHLRRGRGKTAWISLAAAPTVIVAWYAANCIHYGRPLWEITAEYIQSRNPLGPGVLWTKWLSILEYQGWLIIFPLFIFYLLARDLKWRALVFALIASIYVAQWSVPDYRWIDKGIFVAGLTAGFFVTLEMGKIAWSAFFKGRETIGLERIDGQFIGLWYFGFFAYCLFFLTEGSARYILPMLPPVILCFFRLLEVSEILEYRIPRRWVSSAMLASGSLVLSLVWGLALSRADLEFAEIYPKAAAEFSRIADDLKSYSSGEWGFRYYLGRTGAPPLPENGSLVRGASFIAVPKLAHPNEIPADLRSMAMLVERLVYRSQTPLRTMDWQTPSAFYSTGWGLIPFSLSDSNLEEIEIFQINYMAEQLPWAKIETGSGTRPWPGLMLLNGKSQLAILLKPGTSLRYPWPFREPMKLELQCGISAESYGEGSGEVYEFEIRQWDKNGSVTVERLLSLRPGIRKEDRDWQPLQLILKEAAGGVLEFRYGGTSATGIGAFAGSIIRPMD